VLRDTTAVGAACALLRAHFRDLSVAELFWTLYASTVLHAVRLVPPGRLADLLGRKRLFRQGLARLTAASARWPGAGTPACPSVRCCTP
jgi:hypothetical protein